MKWDFLYRLFYKKQSASFILTLALLGSTLTHSESIDFTDANNHIPNGSAGNLDYKLSAHILTLWPPHLSDGSVTYNINDSEKNGCVSAGTSLACDGDGLGINYNGNTDEIDGYFPFLHEILKVELSSTNGLDIILETIEFLDLFAGEGANISINETVYSTPGLYSDKGGYAITNLNSLNVGTNVVLKFFTNYNWESDFAVARINVSQIPIPATVWLLGSALLGFLGLRRLSQTSKD